MEKFIALAVTVALALMIFSFLAGGDSSMNAAQKEVDRTVIEKLVDSF